MIHKDEILNHYDVTKSITRGLMNDSWLHLLVHDRELWHIFSDPDVIEGLCTCDYFDGKHSDDCMLIIVTKRYIR